MSTDFKNYITVQTPRLTIAEIKSSHQSGTGDNTKNWFETSTGLAFDGVETIGMVTKVGTAENSSWFLINDMKDESIIVSVSGDFADEDLKKAATSVPMNGLVVVRGKANIYKDKEGKEKYSIRPRDIVAIDKDDTVDFRKWWYWTVLISRIENAIPIEKDSDLFSFLNGEKIKYHGIDDKKIEVDATIVKVAPKQIVVKEGKKEDRGEPAAKPAKVKSKAKAEAVIEKETPKVTKALKEKEKSTKKVTSVGKDDMEKIKETILDFINKAEKPSTDEVRKEMTEGRNIDEKIVEKAMVDMVMAHQIKIDDDEKVHAT